MENIPLISIARAQPNYGTSYAFSAKSPYISHTCNENLPKNNNSTRFTFAQFLKDNAGEISQCSKDKKIIKILSIFFSFAKNESTLLSSNEANISSLEKMSFENKNNLIKIIQELLIKYNNYALRKENKEFIKIIEEKKLLITGLARLIINATVEKQPSEATRDRKMINIFRSLESFIYNKN